MSIQPPNRASPTKDARPDSTYIVVNITFTLIQCSFIVISTDPNKTAVVGYDIK